MLVVRIDSHLVSECHHLWEGAGSQQPSVGVSEKQKQYKDIFTSAWDIYGSREQSPHKALPAGAPTFSFAGVPTFLPTVCPSVCLLFSRSAVGTVRLAAVDEIVLYTLDTN